MLYLFISDTVSSIYADAKHSQPPFLSTALEAVSKEEIIMEQTQKDIKNLIEKLQQFLSDGNSLTPDVSRCILQEKHGIAQAQLDLQVCFASSQTIATNLYQQYEVLWHHLNIL